MHPPTRRPVGRRPPHRRPEGRRSPCRQTRPPAPRRDAQELVGVTDLYQKNLIPIVRYMQLQRDQARLQANAGI